MINRPQHIRLLEFDSLHFVVELHLPIELDDLLGLLLEVAHRLLQCLELVLLGVTDHALQADILKALQAERLQLFIVLAASLLR